MRPEGHEVAFAVLGRRLTARHVTPAVKAWLQQAWLFLEHDLPPHPYAIAVDLLAAAPGLALRGKPASATVEGRTLPFTTAAGEWELREAGGGVRFTLRAGEARIAAWGLDAGERAAPLYLALQVALAEALRGSGLMPLHAAVAARGERGTAFLGKRGTGKSTTLIRATREGWRPVAEDRCWLDPDSLVVYGWDRAVRARPDALERFFPDLQDAPATADGRRLVRYDRLAEGASRQCTLAALRLLARDPADTPSRLEAAPAAEIVKTLWESTGVALAATAQQRAATVIAKLARDLPAQRLVLGGGSLPANWEGSDAMAQDNGLHPQRR